MTLSLPGYGAFRCLVTRAALMSVAAAATVSAAPLSGSDAVCDGPHVVQDDKRIVVSPSGSDDTANLQCALDRGVAAGPGADIEISRGTFHTNTLRAFGFRGTL